MPSIPPDIERFVAQHIDGPEQLDILLFLFRNPGAFNALDVGRAVYTVPASATVGLEHLATNGFAVSTGGGDPAYSYRPASEELNRGVMRLADAYAQDRVGVIKLVHARAADPAQDFADAFRMWGRR